MGFYNFYLRTELRVLERSVQADQKITWLVALIQNSSFVNSYWPIPGLIIYTPGAEVSKRV